MKNILRRTLLKQGTFTAASAAMLGALPEQLRAESLARATGIQLYTVGKELKADMQGTLSRLAAIGYRRVESAGLGGKSAAEFRKALDDAGLKCPSSHIFLAPGQTAPEYFDAVKMLGSKYVVTSVLIKPATPIKSADDYQAYVAAMTKDDYRRMAVELNKLGEQARSAGLQLAYHNHNLEFRRLNDGTTIYEMLMAETDPALMKMEIDCGWADLAGHPPIELFKKYSGRVRMLHIKDFVAVSKPIITLDPRTEPQWTELGSGHIDWRKILAAAPAAGVEQIFVEQEPPFVKFTPLEAAKVDYAYLQSIA